MIYGYALKTNIVFEVDLLNEEEVAEIVQNDSFGVFGVADNYIYFFAEVHEGDWR